MMKCKQIGASGQAAYAGRWGSSFMRQATTRMGAVHHHRLALSLASMVAAILIFGRPVANAAATRVSPAHHEARAGGLPSSCTTTATDVAQTVQHICGSTPVEEAILAVNVQRGEAADATGRALAGLGLLTALDLQFLQPEAVDELMDVLKSDRVSLGDRAKVQLLVGNRAHLGRLVSSTLSASQATTRHDLQQLQHQQNDET